jgi:hypothetical protein
MISTIQNYIDDIFFIIQIIISKMKNVAKYNIHFDLLLLLNKYNSQISEIEYQMNIFSKFLNDQTSDIKLFALFSVICQIDN